jgi:hypothetical protein
VRVRSVIIGAAAETNDRIHKQAAYDDEDRACNPQHETSEMRNSVSWS